MLLGSTYRFDRDGLSRDVGHAVFGAGFHGSHFFYYFNAFYNLPKGGVSAAIVRIVEEGVVDHVDEKLRGRAIWCRS
eukprot:COSAG06_NODE_64254_length_260_cov_0.627329_1_plen_76_part_01